MRKRTGNFCRIFLHFVWSTKNREPMIDDDLRMATVKVFHSKAVELGVYIIEANGPSDHMHVLLKSNATVAASDIAKGLKGSSSHFVNHEILKNDDSRKLYWQDGYGVTSVSPGAVKSVGNYIRGQQEHHKSDHLIADFEP